MQTPMRLRGKKVEDDISFDTEELERQPLTEELRELAVSPSVDLMLVIAEKRLGHESPKLREFAEECKTEIKGENKADKRARLRYKRAELWGDGI